MSYRITISDTDAARSFERELSHTEVISVLFALGTSIAPVSPTETTAAKRTYTKKARKPDAFDSEPAPRKRFDKEEIRRLLTDSDLEAQEIADKIGCSYMTVWTIKKAMQRNGEL